MAANGYPLSSYAMCQRAGLQEVWQSAGLCLSSFLLTALCDGMRGSIFLLPALALGGWQGYGYISQPTLSSMVEQTTPSVFLLVSCAAWICFNSVYLYPRPKAAWTTMSGIKLK